MVVTAQLETAESASSTVVKKRLRIRWGKVLVFLLCLAPLGNLIWKTQAGLLGADPVTVLTHATGDWTLRFLLITLGITPLRRLTRQYWLIQYRRMLGLFAFFYGCQHLIIWIALYCNFDVHSMLGDIYKRRYITAGMAAFALMLPLAVTSTRGWIRRLGKRWALLHRLIYFSAIAGVVHYWWLVKKDISLPRMYAIILGALLLYRVIAWLIEEKSGPQRLTGSSAQ